MRAGERLAHAHFRMAELYEKWNYAKTPAEALQALADMQRGIAELSDAIAQASRETPDRFHPPVRFLATGKHVGTPRSQRVRGHVRRR